MLGLLIMNRSEEIELYRKSRELTVISPIAEHPKRLIKRNRSEDDIVLSVLKTPLRKNTISPFKRIFSSAEEHVDRDPEEEPFNKRPDVRI